MEEQLTAELEKRILGFARHFFLDRWQDEDDGDFLPVWKHHSFVGSGDYPKAYRDKGAAKRVCVNQCNRDGHSVRGFVVERRQERLYLYEVAKLGGDGFRGWPDCYKQPLCSERLDGLSDWEVALEAKPRSRPSALSERALALV